MDFHEIFSADTYLGMEMIETLIVCVTGLSLQFGNKTNIAQRGFTLMGFRNFVCSDFIIKPHKNTRWKYKNHRRNKQ